jgi:formylglycine-generating enzyme required for sulfatase activity
LSELIIRESLGERRIPIAELPVAVGGAGSAIVMAGRPDGAEAYLGLHEDQLFIQPVDGAEVLHNGLRVRRSTWLHGGDVVNFGAARIRIEQRGDRRILQVEDGSTGNITAPPILPADARVSGESDAESERIDVVQFRASEADSTRPRFVFNPARLTLAAVALVSVAVLWFIFTAISVSVHTTPAEADIQVRGGLLAVPLGQRLLLRPGNYRVRAEHQGYRPAELDITVTKEPNQRFELSLEKLPGRLQIETPVAARVSVDGNELGNAPGEFELTPGKHRIAIAAERYQPFAADVEIAGAGELQSFQPQLVPNWADVNVTSEPAGAQVLIDGKARGATPLRTEVLAGNHPIELRLEGFKPWTTDVQVKAGEPLALGPVKLGLPDGRLALRSEPSGASVSVSGVYRGQTPLELELRPDLAHEVVITKPGYEAATRQVSLGAGERRSLSVPLAGVFGEVTVRAQPADAQVFVDGELSGAVNRTLKLVATTHEIAIRKQGFVEYKTTITPRPGVPQVIETSLMTPAQARLASTPATIRTKAEQTLKLMPTGRFTMGSPRREPGRRANEAQRAVQIARLFYISVHEVTNAQFRKFRSSHRSGIVGQHTLDLDNQPVVGVAWEDAVQFCNWLSAQEGLPPAYERKGDTFVAVNPMTKGYRLPTDAEWEWVARRNAGGELLRYPWGDALPVSPGSGNYADANARLLVQNVIPGYDDGFAVTSPVGKFPPNPLGVYDMGGNVAEWVHDYYLVVPASTEVAIDPMGPSEGTQHVIRGSSWKHSSVTDLRLAARDFGTTARNDVGFRIARNAE